MIEYLYSRTIMILTSISLAGIVALASAACIHDLSRLNTEEIASTIIHRIEMAEEMNADILVYHLRIDERGEYSELKIQLHNSIIIVEDGISTITRSLDTYVYLEKDEKFVDCIIAYSQSIITITSTEWNSGREKHIIIEVVNGEQYRSQSSPPIL